ncbi:hypothetical protein E3N88_09144 [Mikania micrantha]|uniref:Tf2-1-like SH3-like domain-containing protein n=1 Tax=Mikania micrantha TaxID=192012 RepID=A0A5N6PJ63_9ASTR|nr:hypothetical protein E3N88_09144 [Mikania micrantha]
MHQRRWLELLKDYDANIQYHLGKANIESDLISRIEEAQKEDGELWAITENLEIGKQSEFRIDENGVIWCGKRLCVPDNAVLRESLLSEAHSSPFSIHPGSTKMYRDLRQNFCGLLQPLDIPLWKWDDISMDFVTGLPKTFRKNDAICVISGREPGMSTCALEFAYNNSWQASIGMAPFELLYDRKCRAPICWDEVGEKTIEGPELVQITNEKVAIARERLKEAQSKEKSYADKHQRTLEFNVGDKVFLKVSPCRGVRRFGLKGKLSPRFIGPFEILEQVGEISYRLALPPQLSHVHNVFHVSLLRGYNYHPLHIVNYPISDIREDLSYEEAPEEILDRQERVMRRKTIPFVKILWKNHSECEATWELEDMIRSQYPNLFES